MPKDVMSVEIELKTISIQRALFQEPDRSTEEYSSSTIDLFPTIEVEKSLQRIQVKVIVQAYLDKEDGQEEERIVVGILEAHFLYEVKGLQGIRATKKVVNVPTLLTSRLLHDAYLTTRGIWYAKTVGMRANDAILPFSEPEQLLKALDAAER